MGDRSEAVSKQFESPTDYGQLRIETLKDPDGNLIHFPQPIGSRR